MARFTLVAPFEKFHGKIKQPDQDSGLVAFSTAKAGNVCRNWVCPANPKSTQQTMIRGLFSAAAVAYKSLTVSEALAWRTLAAQINKTNILGISYALSGIALYQQVNVMRQLNGQATSDTAPTFADIPVPITAITSIEYADGTLTTVLDCTGLADGCLVLMRVTDSIDREDRLFRRNELRIGSTTETACFGTVSSDEATITTALTQVTVAATEYVGCEFTAMSADYLARSPWFVSQQLVSAP